MIISDGAHNVKSGVELRTGGHMVFRLAGTAGLRGGRAGRVPAVVR
ncbi:MAG TPA: hypothetical protein VI932_04080 [Bacteroidota bacterium]|nr:hypothetical protein [Bacteroidota bacterium]